MVVLGAMEVRIMTMGLDLPVILGKTNRRGMLEVLAVVVLVLPEACWLV